MSAAICVIGANHPATGGAAPFNAALVGFTSGMVALRAAHPVFRRRRFFEGRPIARARGGSLPDIAWFTPAGEEMATMVSSN